MTPKIDVEGSCVLLFDLELTQMEARSLGTRLMNAAQKAQTNQEKEIATKLMELIIVLNRDCDWDWNDVMQLVYDGTSKDERASTGKTIEEFGEYLGNNISELDHSL